MKPVDASMERYIRNVESYVLETKGWRSDDFEIQFNRDENGSLVFWVVHVHDKDAEALGGGQSVEVFVEEDSGKVLKELAFQ